MLSRYIVLRTARKHHPGFSDNYLTFPSYAHYREFFLSRKISTSSQMSSEQTIWRLAYSPAPESGIRSTLQPNSPIYQTGTEFEEEDESSVPNSPPHSSPIQNDGTDAATRSSKLVSSLQSTEPRIYLRVPPLDPTRKGRSAKHTSPSSTRRKTSSSTTPSAISSRQNSQNPDRLTTSMFQGYVINEQGDKRYTCPQCDKQFGRIHDRKRHMEESTSCRGGFGNALDIEIPMWVCEKCGYSFSRRDSMNRHQKNPDACKAYRLR